MPAQDSPGPYHAWHEGQGAQVGHKSAPHMHVLGCTCSDVRQFFERIIMMDKSVPCYAMQQPLACFVNTCVFASYSEGGEKIALRGGGVTRKPIFPTPPPPGPP